MCVYATYTLIYCFFWMNRLLLTAIFIDRMCFICICTKKKKPILGNDKHQTFDLLNRILCFLLFSKKKQIYAEKKSCHIILLFQSFFTRAMHVIHSITNDFIFCFMSLFHSILLFKCFSWLTVHFAWFEFSFILFAASIFTLIFFSFFFISINDGMWSLLTFCVPQFYTLSNVIVFFVVCTHFLAVLYLKKKRRNVLIHFPPRTLERYIRIELIADQCKFAFKMKHRQKKIRSGFRASMQMFVL